MVKSNIKQAGTAQHLLANLNVILNMEQLGGQEKELLLMTFQIAIIELNKFCDEINQATVQLCMAIRQFSQAAHERLHNCVSTSEERALIKSQINKMQRQTESLVELLSGISEAIALIGKSIHNIVRQLEGTDSGTQSIQGIPGIVGRKYDA